MNADGSDVTTLCSRAPTAASTSGRLWARASRGRSDEQARGHDTRTPPRGPRRRDRGRRHERESSQLPVSNINSPSSTFKPLKGGVTYQASAFPLPLRVYRPWGRAAAWGGAQWKTNSRGKPAFGWVALAHPPLNNPQGDVIIETAFGATSSVAATISRLRAGGSHAPDTNVGGTSFQQVSPVRLAGYLGQQFDGNVWGIFGHTFVPFSAKTHGASPADSFHLQKGEVFRLMALDVKGKTIALLFENWKLPADEFPPFSPRRAGSWDRSSSAHGPADRPSEKASETGLSLFLTAPRACFPAVCNGRYWARTSDPSQLESSRLGQAKPDLQSHEPQEQGQYNGGSDKKPRRAS